MNRREIFGWCMYDFANSGYAASIQVVVFATYFTSVVVPAEGADLGVVKGVSGEALWGWVFGFSMLLVSIATPVLGAAADYSGSKKRFLIALCVVGCVATGLMFFVQAGDYWLAMALVVAANFGMAGGNAFYNAFLPQIAPPEKAGRVSAWAWALGYAGSALCLLLNLAMIREPALFGLTEEASLHVRVVFLSVGVWWLVFAIPTFLWVRERPGPDRRPDDPGMVRTGVRRVVDTVRHLRAHRNAVRFLLAFFLYNDGVQTVIAMSAVFAVRGLGMDKAAVIPIFLAIQLVAIPGTLVIGYLVDRFGHKPTLLACLAVWLVGVAAAYYVTTEPQYWALCLVLGFSLGGVQAASRSLFARLVPEERSGEFFGFYALVGKSASILGPIVFGSVAFLTGSVHAAVFWLLPFFIGGIVLLARVTEPPVRRAGQPTQEGQ